MSVPPKNLDNVGEYAIPMHSVHNTGSKTVATERLYCGFSKKCMVIIGAAVTVSVLLIAAIVVAVVATEAVVVEEARITAETGEIYGVEFAEQIPSFVATLDFNGEWSDCAATMITDMHAITAANCIQSAYRNRTLKMEQGWIGALDMKAKVKNGGKPFEIIGIAKVETYTDWKGILEYNRLFRHDIALITFDKRVDRSTWSTFSPFPMCSGPMANNRRYASVFGYGIEKFGLYPSEALRRASLKYISRNNCQEAIDTQYGKSNLDVVQGMMCFEGAKDERDGTCQKDEGAPLVAKVKNTKKLCLAGVSSWKFNCDAGPGIFTEISVYMKWIEERLAMSREGVTWLKRNRDGQTKCTLTPNEDADYPGLIKCD